MVRANVKILEALKQFLHDVTSHEINRAFFTSTPTDFSRERDLPMAVVIEMLLNFFKRSLPVEIQEFFENTLGSTKPPTQSAFCQQRSKLKAAFFQVCNEVLCDAFYLHYGMKAKRWRDFLLLACDGSTLYLPLVKELIKYFGTQDNQHGQKPMARIVQIFDVLNGITLWADITGIRQAESTILCQNLHHVPKNSLLLLDRYFPSFALMYLLGKKGIHYVMRCKLGFNQEVKAFVHSRKSSKIVELKATAQIKSRLGELGCTISAEEVIKVRLVGCSISAKQTEVLITDLLDEQLYGVEDFKALYALRWKIETNYGKQKNQMQMEQFSGLRVLCVQQDYHACVLVSNLHALVEQQSQPYLKSLGDQREHAYKINTNVSLAAMKHWVVKLFTEKDIEPILLLLQHAFERNVVPVRPGRHFKRTRKAKRHKSKYQTFTNYKRSI